MRCRVFGNITPLLLAGVGVLLAGLPQADAQPAPKSKTIAPFVLPDTAGKPWSSADHQGKKAYVVLFLGTQCPINNSYAPRWANCTRSTPPRAFCSSQRFSCSLAAFTIYFAFQANSISRLMLAKNADQFPTANTSSNQLIKPGSGLEQAIR